MDSIFNGAAWLSHSSGSAVAVLIIYAANTSIKRDASPYTIYTHISFQEKLFENNF